MLLLFILSTALCFGLPAFSFASEGMAPGPVLSFQEFSRKVLEYYPKLKAAQGDVDTALARQMQARAGHWPSVDLSLGYKITEDPVDVFGTLLRQERFTSADFDLKRLNTPDRHQDFTTQIHMDWPLFDAMQTVHRVRSARANVKAAESEEAFTLMEARLMAQDAYFNAVTLERLAVLVNEVYASASEDLKKASDLKEKGMVLGADYYAARVMFGDLTRMKNEVSRQKKAMAALLNILMGEPLEREWALAPGLKEAVPFSRDAQKSLQTAFSNRPDLLALDNRYKSLEAELSRARSSSLPALIFFGDATNDRNKIGSPGGSNYSVGLKARMPLWDPALRGKVSEARSQQVRLEHDIALYKDNIKREVVEALARQDVLKDNLGVFKGMSEDAAEAVMLMVPLYNEGRKSIKDLFEARRAYLQSREAYEKALSGVWLCEGRMLFLTGTLSGEQMDNLVQGAVL
jgi:outer membrane protein TolC